MFLYMYINKEIYIYIHINIHIYIYMNVNVLDVLINNIYFRPCFVIHSDNVFKVLYLDHYGLRIIVDVGELIYMIFVTVFYLLPCSSYSVFHYFCL